MARLALTGCGRYVGGMARSSCSSLTSSAPSARRTSRPALPAPAFSTRLVVSLAPEDVGMFRFLLEGYDHLAGFTVLDRQAALLKVFCSPHQRLELWRALGEIASALHLEIRPWPRARGQEGA